MLNTLLLALLSGLLLLISGFVEAMAPIRLVALVPLLFADYIAPQRWHSWLAMLLFTIVARSSYWLVGLGVLHLPLLLAALLLFTFVKSQHGGQRGYVSFIFLWTAAMALPYYIPWQGEASKPLSVAFISLAEWQKIPSTFGFFGAEIWILTFNVLSFRILLHFRKYRQTWPALGQFALLILVGVPLMMFVTYYIEPVPILSNPQQGWSGLLPGDRFAARLSFFIAGFLMLFSIVTGYLRSQKAL